MSFSFFSLRFLCVLSASGLILQVCLLQNLKCQNKGAVIPISFSLFADFTFLIRVNSLHSRNSCPLFLLLIFVGFVHIRNIKALKHHFLFAFPLRPQRLCVEVSNTFYPKYLILNKPKPKRTPRIALISRIKFI